MRGIYWIDSKNFTEEERYWFLRLYLIGNDIKRKEINRILEKPKKK